MATMKRSDAIAAKKVVTHEARLAFPDVFTARAFKNQDAKFSVTLLFPKSTDLAKAADLGNGRENNSLKKAAFNAAREKWGPNKDEWPELRWPWRDGDKKKNLDGFEGHIYVKASSKADNPPGVVDQKLKPITSHRVLYAGCWVRCELIAFAYDHSGNRGISFALMNIQKLRDDDSFTGNKEAKDVFGEVDDGSDSEDSYGDDSDDDAFG